MEKSFRQILLLTALVCLIPGCRVNKSGLIINTVTLPDQVVKNFSLDKYNLADHQWNFQALRADVYEKRGKLSAVNVKMKFYENNKVSSVISADKAVMDTNTGDVKAEGRVVMVSMLKSTTLYADLMVFNSKAGKISSDSFIRQEKDDTVITGVGLDAAADLSEATILKNVKVVKKIK